MSQHIKSNTDLSNNSNFDADVMVGIGGLITDLSHQESNATDRSSESASVLQPNGMGITLMGLNHLQSSPLQKFVNPNIAAPILTIPPSKVEVPDVTPNGDEKQNHNQYNHSNSRRNALAIISSGSRNKPPDVQLPDDDEKDIHDRQHPITPNTFNELSSPRAMNHTFTLSPIPPPQSNDSPSLTQPHIKNISDFSPTDMAQFAAMSRFIPEFWDCLRDLTLNVNSIQRQFSKLNHSSGKSLNLNHSAQSSTQTRYRSASQSQSHTQSQSSSSINSLRTQSSINTLNSLAAHGVIYANHPGANNESMNMIPETSSHRSVRSQSTFNANIPGSRNNEKTSSRRNNRRKKSVNLLPQPKTKKSIVYNNYSQYRYPRRKSIGPGAVVHKSPKSPHQAFAYSPKGIKQYQLTADSLELYAISQRQKKLAEEQKSEELLRDNTNKKRNRSTSQTLFSSKEKKQRKRRTISEVNNNNKIDDAEGVFSDEEDLYDDEVSLDSTVQLDNIHHSMQQYNLEHETVIQRQGNTALSIIHSTSEHSQFNKKNANMDDILFEEEVEGKGKEKLSNKFHRKKKRKPSSSAASSVTHRSNSELSISSMANTADTYNSRSVPQSPAPDDTETAKHALITAATAMTRTRRKSAGTSSHHLYPTPTSKRAPTLVQSRSAHNIYAIKATAPNTPSKGDHSPTPTTPRNTPNKTAIDATTMSNSIAPMNVYDIYSITETAHKRRNSLTPPQEDKEQDDIQYGLSIGPFDEESAGGDVVIVDDEAMIVNADRVHEVRVYNGYHQQQQSNGNVVEETVNALQMFTEQEHQNGEDSVSISMTSSRPPSINSSRPPSTKLNKNVHFDMHSIRNDYSIHDIEEHKVSTDDAMSTTPEIVTHHNLLPSQVQNARNTKRGKRDRSSKSILKLKDHIAYHHLNGKNRRGNLRKLKLSQQNLKAHNGLNQLKNKLMDAKLEKQHVAKMTSEQLQQMLIYINRIQWLILDEKQKRECCKICSIATTSFALLLPCNHQNVCYHCASTLKDCPLCNENVRQIVFPKKR
eukprot:35057_1